MNIRPYLVTLGLASALFVAGCDRADNDVDTNDIDMGATADNIATETEQAATTVGEKIDDGVITTKVKSALLADDTVKGLDINVDTVNGTVTLNGTVDNQAQADRAVQVTQGIEGVANVDNKLVVNDSAT